MEGKVVGTFMDVAAIKHRHTDSNTLLIFLVSITNGYLLLLGRTSGSLKKKETFIQRNS